MKRVLIISTSMEEQRKFEEVVSLHNPSGFSIETTASFGQDSTFWTSQSPDILILNVPEDETLQEYFYIKLRRDVPGKQALIILCNSISTALTQLSVHFRKMRMLKTPVDGFSIFRAVNELLTEYREGQRQIHPRYLTEQAIQIQSDLHKGQVNGVMKNLSLSGAYFESSETTFEIKVGDFVKLSAMIGEPAKQYLFDVKVVWSKVQASGATGYGVTFVNKEDVYNNLLKNL